MEKKTMGSFIAALRRASGMTQKELAERLNVSDKSVSRWERDDGAPDLALIPVLAEIFGVTCDELLRGERMPEESGTAAQPSPKIEQQRRRILAAGLSKFKSHSCIALALSAAGFLLAMACNTALERALLGFFLGAVFFVAAAAVEAVQINAAFLAVDGGEDAEVNAYRRAVVRWAKWVYGTMWVLFACTLPLLLAFYPVSYDGMTISRTRVGVTLGLGQMLGVVLAALVIWVLALSFITPHLLKRGVYALTKREEEAYRKNRRLKRFTVLGLCAALGLSAFLNSALTGFGDPVRSAKGTKFTNMEDFKTYMEKYVWSDYYEDDIFNPIDFWQEVGYSYSDKVGDMFYNEYGTPLEQRSVRGEVLADSKGNVLCNFLWRNHQVVKWEAGADENGGLPITVYTQDDIRAAHRRVKAVNIIFYGVYAAEAAVALIVYLRRRVRV